MGQSIKVRLSRLVDRASAIASDGLIIGSQPIMVPYRNSSQSVDQDKGTEHEDLSCFLDDYIEITILEILECLVVVSHARITSRCHLAIFVSHACLRPTPEPPGKWQKL